ncbi:hypothetical protein [Tersicoccus sp. Bi-70]|uniref:hypothetical protein n=1 Tax=Tersicoccus sp. Bi-70 TaxID=1897634 RepID=UPI000975E5D0|nr:hypothetical protein [Tersicoccus sp. Bi-70]OMH33011.1 hypothetical protein BGP79_05445 [Tersicoccus sp. Bi-70]
MPWWFWILLWGALLLASAAALALACWRVIRTGLALVREVDRAATALSVAGSSDTGPTSRSPDAASSVAATDGPGVAPPATRDLA